jgi:beta-D-xylosidase 4
VERLGIPPYNWWSEGLHGTLTVGKERLEYVLTLTGIAGPYTNFSANGEYSYSTSFPQPILMGAAFDDDLITAVAKVISTEARAFNNANRFVLSSDLRASLLISEQDWFGLLDTKH